jgi:hypothetical protein
MLFQIFLQIKRGPSATTELSDREGGKRVSEGGRRDVSERDSFRLDGVGRCFSAHGVVQHMLRIFHAFE